jgi:purine-binding chemotaxis protein CheW
MTFRVAGGLYALPSEAVSEVVKPPPVARVPLAPKALLGLGSLRGVVLPVASLALLVGRGEAVRDESARVVVLDGASPFGVLIDAIDAMTDVEISRVKHLEADLTATDGELLAGVFPNERGEQVRVLDVKAILEKAFTGIGAEQQARMGVVRPATQRTQANDERDVLIVFGVAGQEFALPVANVIEVMPAPAEATQLPHSEAAVTGMIALRGGLLPLLSLKHLLGLTGDSQGGVIVVAAIGPATVGLAVDSVREIMRVHRSLLEPVPPVIAGRTKGEAKVQSVIKADGGERLISVLGPEQLFREDIMTRIRNQAPAMAGAAQAAVQADERTFLVIRLAGQEFGLAIPAVEEVAMAPEQVTRLPRAPDFLRGVTNLRGAVLPIIDQRRRFGLDEAGEGEGRRLVVIRIGGSMAGLIVDGVSEVLRTPQAAIEPAPRLAGGAILEGVLNLRNGERMILLLDPARLLTTSEAGMLDALARTDEA